MPAAEQDQTEQELSESICQPRHVRLLVPGSGAERGSQVLATRWKEQGRLADNSEAGQL